MKRAFGLAALALVATLLVPVTASADTLDASGNGVLGDTVPLNTMLVFFAAVLVLFMQAGFALLEIGFSRSKNAGTGIAKILTNLSIAAIAFYAVGFGVRVRQRLVHGHRRLPAAGLRRSADRVRRDGPLRRHHRVEVALPVRVLRGVAGDRLGHDARADQVRRLRRLRGRVRRGHLPDRRPLGVRRRLAADRRVLPRRPRPDRHAGLRRLDGGPPDRCDRRSGGAAAARPAQGQVRARRQAAGDPGSLHAARRPGHPDPVRRLVRLQPGLGARRG